MKHTSDYRYKVSVAIARNGKERRIAEFRYFNDDAHSLMETLQDRNISACLCYPEMGVILAYTTAYGEVTP